MGWFTHLIAHVFVVNRYRLTNIIFLFTVEITAILVIRDLLLCIAVLLAVSILQNVFDIIVVLLDDLVFNKALHFLVDLVQLSSQITNFSFLQTHVIH